MRGRAEIVAVEHTLAPRPPRGWWLDVVWRFANQAGHPLYILAGGPLSIVDGQPIVLNHTVTGHPMAVDPNVDPELQFVTVEALGHLDLPRTYPLPPVDLREPRAVVGTFAVGSERPDPEWGRGRMSEAVGGWQTILSSSPFEIGAAGARS